MSPRKRGNTVQPVAAATQDGRPLERALFKRFDALLAAITGRVTVAEERLDDLASGQFYIADIELQAGHRSGETMFAPARLFPSNAVGSPVLMLQAPEGDAAEWTMVTFAAEIVNERQLRVQWSASSGAPATVRVLYMFGRLDHLDALTMSAAADSLSLPEALTIASLRA